MRVSTAAWYLLTMSVVGLRDGPKIDTVAVSNGLVSY